jgi:hypothetical protein
LPLISLHLRNPTVRSRSNLSAMQTRITEDEIETAARQLATSDQGRAALQKFGQWIEQDDFGLDLLNQRAFLALLGGVWTGRSQRVREAIARAVAQKLPARQ